jgi:drug/metabolite transporter (DMT)-like permease
MLLLMDILSKLLSEGLLSLYPVFVKNIGLPLSLQTWSRCFSYAIISGFFIDYAFVFKTMFTYSGILLSLVTILHIYTSYKGFQLLDSGVAYSIFYLYPIMILLMAGQNVNVSIIGSLLGVFLLADTFSIKSYEGVFMIVLAAFTEAIIYFLVKNIKTLNNWNHIFISYFLGAILLSAGMFRDIVEIKLNSRLSISLLLNSGIGLIGYVLRFYAVSRLDTVVYSSLSYFGIVMAFVYGIMNGEYISFKKISGALLVILSNIWLLK